MLTAIRTFAKSWAAKVLMAVLAVSFIGWGATTGGMQAVRGDEVIRAGSRTIDSGTFKREYDGYRKSLEQQNNGQPITAEIAEKNRLDSVVLNGVATRESFAELLIKSGVRPSDKLILEQIQKIPDFFDPVTGRFDRKQMAQLLAQNNATPQMLDAQIRDSIAAQFWARGLQNGLQAPRTYGALGAVYILEARDLAYVSLPRDAVPAPPAPTDAQLKAVIAENKSAFTVPELRELTLIGFSPQAVGENLGPIDPAELKKRFDFRKDTMSRAETRSIVQIPVKTPAMAQQVTARLNAGEAPAAVAKAVGASPVEFTDKPASAIPDRKVGEAAFKAVAGQVLTVQGDLGLAVVKVVAVAPGHQVTIEEIRPMLEAEIRKDMAAEKAYAQVQAFDDARQTGMGLADAAAKVGVKTDRIGPLSADGVTAQGQRFGLPPQILQTAFSLPSGGESDVADLGDGVSFAVRVEKVLPAHVQSLDEVRGRVTEFWVQRETVRALEAKAKTLADRVQKGETLEAVAASQGLSVSRSPGVTRQNAQALSATIPQQVLGRALAAKPGEVWTARAPNALVVGRVDNVRVAGGPQAAQIVETLRAQMAQDLVREIATSAQTYARTKLKTKVNPALARSAVGFAPLEKGKPEKKG